jgi:hypothetical protein
VLDLVRKTTEGRFEDAVRDFPAAFINTTPPNVEYTPFHLIEHLRIAQWDILEYIRSARHVSPSWPAEFWPSADQRADEAVWAQSLARFRADRQELLALLADPGTDLLAPIAHTPGHTILREAFLVANHGAYHIGEFAILRQVMQTWPANRS